MPLLPTLDYEYTDREVTDTFAGYDHKLRIGAGEFRCWPRERSAAL